MPHMNGRQRKYKKKTKKGGSNIAGTSGPNNTSPSPQIPGAPPNSPATSPNSPATSPVKNPSPNRDGMGQEKKKGPFSRFTRRMPKMPKMKMGDIKNKMMPKKPGFMSGFKMPSFKMPGFFSNKKIPKPNMTGGKRRRTRKKNRKNKKSNKRRRKGSR